MKAVGQRSAGRELLRAFDDDAVVALLHHAGIKRWIALRMRWLRAVDLRRHDRVSAIDVIVTHEFVEGDEVVGELPTGCGKKLWHRSIADKEAADVIWRAAHQAEGRLRPGFREQAARPQIGMGLRNLPGALHRRTGFGRDECHPLAQFGRRGNVVKASDRACRAAKGRMRGYVFDPLAVDEDPPSILERAKIFGTCAHRQFSQLGRIARFDQAKSITATRSSPRKREPRKSTAPKPRSSLDSRHRGMSAKGVEEKQSGFGLNTRRSDNG